MPRRTVVAVLVFIAGGAIGPAVWSQTLSLPRNGSMILLPEISSNQSVNGIASASGPLSDGTHAYGAWERETGPWGGADGGGFPYPDYVLSNHTGIRLSAHSGHGGISFYEQLNSAGTAWTSAGREIARFRDGAFGGSYFKSPLWAPIYQFGGLYADSGQAADYGIYQESGPWTHPYPDLVVSYHTGIKYSAYYGYGGHRFYTGHDGTGHPAGLAFSVGDGDSNTRVHGELIIASTIKAPSRMHVFGEELLYILNKSGVIIGREWGGTGNLSVQGNLTVQGVKNFVMPHPTDQEKEIAFVSLEGPEAGTYCRGSAKLRDGVAVVRLPESFELATAEAGLTAQLTAIGEGQGLYVEAKSRRELRVRCKLGATCPAEFDWMVNGVRRGYDKYQAIRTKSQTTQMAQAPSMGR